MTANKKNIEFRKFWGYINSIPLEVWYFIFIGYDFVSKDSRSIKNI